MKMSGVVAKAVPASREHGGYLSWPHLQLVTSAWVINQAVKRMNVISPPSRLKFRGGEATRAAEGGSTVTPPGSGHAWPSPTLPSCTGGIQTSGKLKDFAAT